MAKNRHGKRDLHSYTIRGTNRVVRAGDVVLMRSSETGDEKPFVAQVLKVEADDRNNVIVKVRWYYRPEETKRGRQKFHGIKEVMLSDHYDVQSAHTIQDKCIVHTLKVYTELYYISPQDYFCRFDYRAVTGTITPDRVEVFCKCQMPYNPDDFMIQCDNCKDWFHTTCLGMTFEQALKVGKYVCDNCASDKHVKKRPKRSASAIIKAELKRQKKEVAV